LKEKKRGMIQEYAEKFGCEYFPKRKPWEIKADLAFPCATQNEILLEDAQKMVKNGIRAVCEGANMPTHIDAADFFNTHGVLFAPGKAANAGGVAVSGLEQTQNAMRLSWTREKVDSHLQEIMKKIHAQCVEYGREKDGIDYVKGANIAGFIKVADTLLCFGVI
jgi:glutamate dehydrogenase (NADP+)